jgi:hypothetical protein
MITLKNNTKSLSKVGCVVTLDPLDPNSFVYASPNAIKAIGIVTEAVEYRKPCKIATIGETANVLVVGSANKGSILRCIKSTDRASVGTAIVLKTGDAPYLAIGEALSSGSGLVLSILNFTYISSSGSSSISEEFETVSKNLKSYPYALVYGVDGLSTITYDLGGGLSVVKTFNYTLSILTSIVLSGDTPSGIELTKTFSYTGVDLTGVAYS